MPPGIGYGKGKGKGGKKPFGKKSMSKGGRC
jgi:hypothetical protein